MLFAGNRDFEPQGDYYNYCLGRMIHDDGDVIKWDWTIYKRVPEFDYTDELVMYKMYQEVHSLKVSPYERDTSKITDMFKRWVNLDMSKQSTEQFDDDYWHEGPLFSK